MFTSTSRVKREWNKNLLKMTSLKTFPVETEICRFNHESISKFFLCFSYHLSNFSTGFGVAILLTFYIRTLNGKENGSDAKKYGKCSRRRADKTDTRGENKKVFPEENDFSFMWRKWEKQEQEKIFSETIVAFSLSSERLIMLMTTWKRTRIRGFMLKKVSKESWWVIITLLFI